ncbi:MAG: hypothetical protein NC541_14665 [bacterium]|nr:hypothetical protein [bacterium]
MSGKQLTADQQARIKKLKEEAIKEVEKIPEGPKRNVLDGGRSEPYYSIGEKLRADIKAILDEQ